MLFRGTVDCITQKALGGNPPPKLSLTVLEAIRVGVARNLEALRNANADVVAQRFQALFNHADFQRAQHVENPPLRRIEAANLS